MAYETKPALLFVRVARVPQDCRYVVEAQLLKLRLYAVAHGLAIRGEIIQVGSDAHYLDPINCLSAYLSQHPEVRVIVVLRSDRITRNVIGYVKLQALIEIRGIEIHFTAEGTVLRTRKKHRYDEIESLLAHYYVDCLSKEIIKGLQYKTEEFPYPFGYWIKQGLIEAHPAKSTIVRILFALGAAWWTKFMRMIGKKAPGTL